MSNVKRKFCAVLCFIMAVTVLASCGNKEKVMWENYKDYFPIGVALSYSAMEAYKDGTLLKEFNSMTCENEMKWSDVHPALDNYNFITSDKMMDFAVQNNMKMRGHALVWHNPKAMPNYVFEDDGETAGKELVLSRMREHIKTVVQHFGDKIYCWDVVNEVIDDNPTKVNEDKSNIYRNSLWYSITGRDFIKEAFIAARAAADEIGFTDLKLYYNDYSMSNPFKREKTLEMLKWLVAEGVPIDGIGMQSHYHLGSFSMDEFEKSILEYSKLGLEVQITELDINVYDESKAEASNPEYFYSDELPAKVEAIQTTIYDRLMQIVRKHKDKVTGVTFWGVADDITWLDREPVLGRKNYPYIFNIDHEKKSSYYAINNFN